MTSLAVMRRTRIKTWLLAQGVTLGNWNNRHTKKIHRKKQKKTKKSTAPGASCDEFVKQEATASFSDPGAGCYTWSLGQRNAMRNKVLVSPPQPHIAAEK